MLVSYGFVTSLLQSDDMFFFSYNYVHCFSTYSSK